MTSDILCFSDYVLRMYNRESQLLHFYRLLVGNLVVSIQWPLRKKNDVDVQSRSEIYPTKRTCWEVSRACCNMHPGTKEKQKGKKKEVGGSKEMKDTKKNKKKKQNKRRKKRRNRRRWRRRR